MSVLDTMATAPASLPACFKAYDVRGRIGVDLNVAAAYNIGLAYAQVLDPLCVVLGQDCRASSPEIADAVAAGLQDRGVNVLDIGVAGTEEVYFATSALSAGGGIEITASHNPIDYNGMKFVGPESRPLTDEEFREIGHLMATGASPRSGVFGWRLEAYTRMAYAMKVVSMVDTALIPRLKIVVNAGNGVAGAATDAILSRLAQEGVLLDVVRVNHDPHCGFPNGIPNPLLPANRGATAKSVRKEGADLGIAWDGDFDRCFLFDSNGDFVEGEYIVGLLASAFLADSPEEAIVHDPRVILNTTNQINLQGGHPVLSRTGHAHFKRAMRQSNAVYGGEMSAHHYFRDFMCCDSGMIPWLKVLEYMGRTGKSLAELVADMKAAFPSSGEINFTVGDPGKTIDRVYSHYAGSAISADWYDGLSMTFEDWRFNIRESSTEPLLRLNVESKGNPALVEQKISEIAEILDPRTNS